MDTNGDGLLSEQEFTDGLSDLFGKKVAEKMFKFVDANGNGEVDY